MKWLSGGQSVMKRSIKTIFFCSTAAQLRPTPPARLVPVPPPAGMPLHTPAPLERSPPVGLHISTARASLHAAAACQPGQPSFPRSVRPRTRALQAPGLPSHTRVCARASSLQPIPPAPSCLLLDSLTHARVCARQLPPTHTASSLLLTPRLCTLRDNHSLSPHALRSP